MTGHALGLKVSVTTTGRAIVANPDTTMDEAERQILEAGNRIIERDDATRSFLFYHDESEGDGIWVCDHCDFEDFDLAKVEIHEAGHKRNEG